RRVGMAFIVGFWTLLCSAWGIGPTLYTYGLPADGPLLTELRKEYRQVVTLGDTELVSYTFPRGSVLLVDGSRPLPPACRPSLYQLRRDGGQLLVFGHKAFNYQPIPKNQVSVVN